MSIGDWKFGTRIALSFGVVLLLLAAARPTSVNLEWALARMRERLARLVDAAEPLAALEEAGCQEFILVPTTNDPSEIDRLLDAIA